MSVPASICWWQLSASLWTPRRRPGRRPADCELSQEDVSSKQPRTKHQAKPGARTVFGGGTGGSDLVRLCIICIEPAAAGRWLLATAVHYCSLSVPCGTDTENTFVGWKATTETMKYCMVVLWLAGLKCWHEPNGQGFHWPIRQYHIAYWTMLQCWVFIK